MTPQDKARAAKAEAYLRMNEKRDAEIAGLKAQIKSDAKVIAALREALTEVLASTKVKASARAKPESYFSPRMEQAFDTADRVLATFEQTAGERS